MEDCYLLVTLKIDRFYLPRETSTAVAIKAILNLRQIQHDEKRLLPRGSSG